MDLTKFIIDIIFTAMNIIILAVAIKIALDIVRYLNNKHQVLQDNMELKKIESYNKNKTVEYSTDTLEFVRHVIGQVAILKFRTFQDNNDLTKVNKTILLGLAKEVAVTANQSLNRSNIAFDDTFFTKEFYDFYVVETSIILIKEMFEKAIGKLFNELGE